MNRNLTALILIILAIGLYFTLTTKVIARGKEVRAVNQEYSKAIESAKKLIAVRDQVIKDYNAISPEDRERLSKMIPGSVDNIRLMIDLNSVASKHGFTLKNLKASADPVSAAPSMQVPASMPAVPGSPSTTGTPLTISTPTLDSVTVSFEVTAPYLQFISFLQDLEANLRIMDLSKLEMDTDETTGQYKFKAELKTYWLRQQ